MRALLIDPTAQTITNINLDDSNTLESKYKAIGCTGVDVISVGNRLNMWVDDKGLMNVSREEGKVVSDFFVLHTYNREPKHMICGKAIVASHNGEGDTTGLPPQIAPETLKPFIRFVPHTDTARQACAEIAEQILDCCGVVDSPEQLQAIQQQHEILLGRAMKAA